MFIPVSETEEYEYRGSVPSPSTSFTIEDIEDIVEESNTSVDFNPFSDISPITPVTPTLTDPNAGVITPTAGPLEGILPWDDKPWQPFGETPFGGIKDFIGGVSNMLPLILIMAMSGNRSNSMLPMLLLMGGGLLGNLNTGESSSPDLGTGMIY